MKKLLPLFIICLSTALHTQAQTNGFYIKAGVGYALPLAGQTIGIDGNPYSGSIANTNSSNSNESSYNVKKASFSSGVQATVGVGYMLSRHVGVELSGVIDVAPVKYSLTASNVLNSVKSYYMNSNVKNYAKAPFFIMPALVYRVGDKKVQGFARGGLAISTGTTVVQEQNNNWKNVYNSPEILNEETTTRFGLGFTGAMGASYSISQNVNVWLEANLLSISLYAKDTKVIQHTLDGAESTVPPFSGTTIKYGNTGSYSSTSSPTYAMPFSNLGFTVGLSFSLSKQTATRHTTNTAE